MKIKSLFFFLFIFSCSNQATRKIASTSTKEIENFGKFNCEVSKTYKKNVLSKCLVPARSIDSENNTEKIFYTLSLQEDKFKDVAYAQGYLMASQIEEGSLAEAINNLKGATQNLSKLGKAAFQGLNRCITKNLEKSLSAEFTAGINGLYQGYITGLQELGRTPKYTKEDFVSANYSIEFGNIVYGILYKAKTEKVKMALQVLGQCGVVLTSSVVDELFDLMVEKGRMKEKFACTGLVAPASSTKGVGLIHARNLEQTSMINSWNKAPVAYLVKEGSHHRYAAFGTAGLIFPGGISGFNEHGISVSLHQMNTKNYDFKYRRGQAEVMPFLQQRILREAKNIDEAVAIVKKTKAVSSWTILISDAKNNEVASIEISADGFEVPRRTTDQPMAQANHFLGQKMQNRSFHSRFSNFLESQARVIYGSHELARDKGKIETDWMIATLASHDDVYENERRAFGRSIARAANIMATVILPQQHEVWVTSGDIMPPMHGKYLGFKVDFANLQFSPIGLKQNDVDLNELHAYKHYVEAYKLAATGDYAKTLEAIEKANAELTDPHLLYVKARLLGMLGKHEKAVLTFKEIKNLNFNLHPYTEARIILYSLYSSSFLPESSELKILPEQAKSQISYARNILTDIDELKVQNNLFPLHRSVHHGDFDIKNKLRLLKAIERGDKKLKLDAVDLSTVD